MRRREVLGMAGATFMPRALANAQAKGPKKKVIVIGAGIAGLSCAYELDRRGHDVTVLEASGRPGGHVRTLHDPFADGLYADLGAEHFYYPGYTEYWRYVKEFGLTPIPYPRRDHLVQFLQGERYTEEDLHSPRVLGKLGFSQREVDFLAGRPWPELPFLYLGRYMEALRDETDPFANGLAALDALTTRELLQREGASAAGLQFFGGSGNALQTIWGAAIKKLRGTDLESKKLFRLKGGNQCSTFGEPHTPWLPGEPHRTRPLRSGRELPRVRKGASPRRRLPCLLRFRCSAQADSGHAAMAGGEGLRDSRDALLHARTRRVSVAHPFLGDGQDQSQLAAARSTPERTLEHGG
jgi:hypothetical protein